MPNSKERKYMAWIRVAIFVVIFIILNWLLNMGLKDDVFMKSNIDRCINSQYSDMFIGTSQCRRAINPEIVEYNTGIYTTNASIPLSSPLDQYYFVKLLCEKGTKPDRIIYECDPYYLSEAKSGGHYYNYPFGKTKAEYIVSALNQDFRVAIAPWSFQMSNVYRMKEVFINNYRYNKYGETDNRTGYQPGGDSFTAKDITDREFEASDTADEYLNKLISLCLDENIELILMQFPISEEVYFNMEPEYRNGSNNYLSEIADNYGITYVNWNLIYEESSQDMYFDNKLSGFIDMEGHMKTDSSGQFSGDMARWLNNYS